MKRLVAQELTLSFVPDAEQRLWRTVMRRKYQITRSRVQLHNRLEALLEEAHIKIASVVSDLSGTSARPMRVALSRRVVSVVLDSAAVERLAVAARPLIAVLDAQQMQAANGLAQEMGLGPVVAALR